ncbi:nuclear transport factor 2 family protein [Nocardioides sp. JQ2195]|uniref:nuclear transport factor 2 family protein n=1 Tax=Nocardioides sp. JQ2195 TaxID=2592334 RepID=UPI00143E76A2|nr:nuclear transport factor 2 family protein [Nocardioides sp. JQ2195]QIX26497.1 nuclear transport factor 2 family protein [Nocardioides sp. JQ2195]
MADLQTISDRIEIADVITRYTRAIDTGTWDGLDTVFTPDALIDYTSAGGTKGSFPEMKAWLARVLPRYVRRQHVIGQLAVTLEPDAAAVTAYFSNPMVHIGEDGSELLTDCGGYYHHRMIRTPDGWRSCELVEETVWTR